MNVRLRLAATVVLLSSVGALWLVNAADRGATAFPADDGLDVTFTPSGDKVEAYDFLEVTLGVGKATAKNPFTDVAVTGEFRREGDAPVSVEGFCDSQDGGTYRIRFMPAKPGKYTYSVAFRQGDATRTHTGRFEVSEGRRRGGADRRPVTGGQPSGKE